jgi:hypothetical protein
MYGRSIQVPSQGEFDALKSDVTNLREQLAGIAGFSQWAKILSDPKNCAKRAEELSALTVQAIEHITAAEQKDSAIDKKIDAQAALFAKERLELEDQWKQFTEWKSSQESRIASEAGKVPALENTIAAAIAMILSESGVRPHPLQGPPDLLDLLRQMFGQKDAHFGEDKTERQTDLTLETEPLEHASRAATVRQSRRPPRLTRHDA